MTTLYDSARSLLVHYDRLLPPGLAPAKVRRKFKFVDKLMSLSVYALVLLMGLRMGADEEVTSSLGSIGIQALLSRC